MFYPVVVGLLLVSLPRHAMAQHCSVFRNATDFTGHDLPEGSHSGVSTVTECCQLCALEPACKAYTLWVSGKTCFLKASDAGQRPFDDHVSGYPGASPPPPSKAPACSLNGVPSTQGSCTCDKPWSGPECSQLNFKPVIFPQGYGMQPQLVSWGGNIIEDTVSGKFHMFVSRMTNDCPLSDWTKNSRIDHAVADEITGPFVFKDVAIPTWSHNAAPVRLKDGSFAIFHIGDGTGSPTGGNNCTKREITPPRTLWPSKQAFMDNLPAGGSTIHISSSLDGPWLPLLNNTLGSCNNPAPWVHPNGTLYCLCGNTMLRSETISGPWVAVSTLSHSGGPMGNYEDPFLYTDTRGFHLLYHVYNTHENPPHGHECRWH